MSEEHLRNAFKMVHKKEFTAQERDQILKLLTRKTVFNNQHRRIFPGVSPDWAKEDICWECKEETGESIDEDLLHCLWTCRAKNEVRKSVLSNLNYEPAIHPSTTLLWGNNFVLRHTSSKMQISQVIFLTE